MSGLRYFPDQLKVVLISANGVSLIRPEAPVYRWLIFARQFFRTLRNQSQKRYVNSHSLITLPRFLLGCGTYFNHYQVRIDP
jgi:hypothetical protein